MVLPLFLRQIWTLAWKDLLLVLNSKRNASTIFRAFTEPIVLSVYMSFIIRIYWPQEVYGIGTPSPIRGLPDAMNSAGGGRNTLALCNYGPSGGEIDKVINMVATSARGSGKAVEILTIPDQLLTLCRSSLSGTTKCYGAAEFYSSTNEGGHWNYTLRSDGSFGYHVNINKNNNDPEIYSLPLQHAIDSAIASVETGTSIQDFPSNIGEYLFTSKTQKEWNDSIRTSIQHANIYYITIVWYLGFIGLCYHIVGVIAREREHGMADLIKLIMPNTACWQPQVAHLLGHHIAFTIVSV